MTDPIGPRPEVPGTDAPVCVRHPNQATRLRCIRCGRPACTDCLVEASVGYQCVDCVRAGSAGVRRSRNVAGASRTGRPVVVPVLVVLNVAIFVLTVAQSGRLNDNDSADAFQWASLVPGLVADGEWWRLVTSGFLHFGPLHLAFNMLALWIIGGQVETVLGRSRLLAVYLVSLLGGSAAVMLFSPVAIQVAGASGAVFGLMGALAVLLYRLRIPAGQAIGLIAANILLSFLIPGISLTAHLGGLVVGAAVTAALVYTPARRSPALQAAAVAGVAVVVLLAIGISL